jgi:malonyl-CoA O-methyltransferase
MAAQLRIDKAAVRRRFERAAAGYDEHARLQSAMAAELLPLIEGEPAAVLELGCGTGRLTACLRERFGGAAIEAVDFAAAMIERARERVPSVRYRLADVEQLEWPPASFDLVISNATAQWLAEPARTLARLAASLRPSGQLLLSSFGPRTFNELDALLAELGHDRGMRLRDADEWKALLAGAGLTEIRTAAREERLLYPDSAAFLRSVKAAGAGYTPSPPPSATLAEALRRYDARFREGGGVVATYELVFLSARRPAD